MIISVKQIMTLIKTAEMLGLLLVQAGGHEKRVDDISTLLEEIRAQQSEELKEIK